MSNDQGLGILSVVATPIGNLSDMTFRAVETLKKADIVLCEDTRMTKRLLERYEIQDKILKTYNEEKSGVPVVTIIEWLEAGKHIALVSDAGTPGISDPGAFLVQKIREALPDLKVEGIPGPSALTTALSIAGVPAHEFTFYGFLPHKKGRETVFKEIAVSERVSVFYESPHRILKALASLEKCAPEKKITIVRELTKIFEEVVSGTAKELLEFFNKNSDKVRGEFVVVVS